MAEPTAPRLSATADERDFERYRSDAKQRLLGTIKVLAGHEVHGLAPSQIAAALHTPPSNVTSDLANLHLAGLAEPVPGGTHWRLSPVLPQIGLAMLNTVEAAQRKVDEVRQRFTRLPK